MQKMLVLIEFNYVKITSLKVSITELICSAGHFISPRKVGYIFVFVLNYI